MGDEVKPSGTKTEVSIRVSAGAFCKVENGRTSWASQSAIGVMRDGGCRVDVEKPMLNVFVEASMAGFPTVTVIERFLEQHELSAWASETLKSLLKMYEPYTMTLQWLDWTIDDLARPERPRNEE